MKSPRGYTHGEAPAELTRAVSLKLKLGWRFERGRFVSPDGQRLAVRSELPKGSAIVPTAPALARSDPAKLTKVERDLARHYQLILPEGAAPGEYLRVVKSWDAIEEATLAPRVSLP